MKLKMKVIKLPNDRLVALHHEPNKGSYIMFSSPLGRYDGMKNLKTTTIKVEDGKVKTYIRLTDKALNALVLLAVNAGVVK